jgi:hypothetical protein
MTKQPRKAPTASLQNPQKPVHGAQGEGLLELQAYSFGTRDDSYGRRMHIALDAICTIPAPEGLIVWLDEHSPSLYDRLTRELPNEISRAWNAQIRIEDFDSLCSVLVDTFRRAADLYSNSKRTPNLFEQREITEGEGGP